MTTQRKIAKILRTSPEVIFELEKKMEKITGKEKVLGKILKENEEKIKESLKKIGLNLKSSAPEIYNSLFNKIKKEDDYLYQFLESPNFNNFSGCQFLINSAKKISGEKTGFFLVEKKAKELLQLNPPQNILKLLGYPSTEDLLKKENLLEIFCALRFVEDPHWLNDVFLKPYSKLSPTDFEEREIKIIVLSSKWKKIGEKFAGKKLHHISHLKELGIIFVIPFEKYPGATLEIFSLILHYLYEVEFYSKIFQKYSSEEDFGQKITSALKGEIKRLPNGDKDKIYLKIIQRYLGKQNPDDPRLLEPHLNPEVIHWEKAEDNLVKLGEESPQSDLEFFKDLDFVGDFFKENIKKEVLISFDLVDNLISLTKGSILGIKYLYHHQEALWNKIFEEYIGKEKIEDLLIDNLDKGYVKLNSDLI